MSVTATLTSIGRELDEALGQAREAYAFTPSSFTASALAAIAAARDAFAAYHAVVIEEGGPKTEPSTVETLSTVEAADDLL